MQYAEYARRNKHGGVIRKSQRNIHNSLYTETSKRSACQVWQLKEDRRRRKEIGIRKAEELQETAP
jgi:hypothetical protein